MPQRKECETEDGYGICPACIHYTFLKCSACFGTGFMEKSEEECPQCNGEGNYMGCELGYDLNGE